MSPAEASSTRIADEPSPAAAFDGLAGSFAGVDAAQPIRVVGRVAGLRGMTVLVQDLPLPVGSLVSIPAEESSPARPEARLGEVIGLSGSKAVVMMLGALGGVRAGDAVVGLRPQRTVGVGWSMLGRVVNGLGEPIDAGGALYNLTPYPIDPPPLPPMQRRRIHAPMVTGVRAVDVMCTLGCGQRVGLFAGPGVGKSTLLGTIARNCAADVSVLALIGERGREVKEFIEGSLGPEGLKRSVVVCSTGDESPLMRIRAAMVACSIAEFFRDRGRQVLLMLDSVTRFAHAHRQVGLSAGEPPASKGYTPGVFAALARLLERAGAVEPGPGRAGGAITGVYTVLVEGDDLTEPVADAARGILDGHLILTRQLAHRGHYPALDVLDSVSRVADDVSDEPLRTARRTLRRCIAAYREVEDLVQIGAYARGSSPEADVAIDYWPRINELLRQGTDEREDFERARDRSVKLAMEIAAALSRPPRRVG
jgi:flagellum-specific ATP synthase